MAIDGGKPYRKTPFPERTPYGEEEVALVTEAIRSQNLFGLGGPKVSALEAEFARLYGAKHAVASTSGTAAIHIALGTVNPEPGDEIITAPITDGGSVVPIPYQNCIPVFADVDDSYNMDPGGCRTQDNRPYARDHGDTLVRERLWHDCDGGDRHAT